MKTGNESHLRDVPTRSLRLKIFIVDPRVEQVRVFRDASWKDPRVLLLSNGASGEWQTLD